MKVYNKTEMDSQYRKQASGYQWEVGRGNRQDRGMELRDTNYYLKYR